MVKATGLQHCNPQDEQRQCFRSVLTTDCPEKRDGLTPYDYLAICRRCWSRVAPLPTPGCALRFRLAKHRILPEGPTTNSLFYFVGTTVVASPLCIYAPLQI